MTSLAIMMVVVVCGRFGDGKFVRGRCRGLRGRKEGWVVVAVGWWLVVGSAAG